MAREHRVEPVAEDEPVEAGGRRDQRRAELPPEPGPLAAVFEQQAGHAEERLAQETPAEGGRDLVINGGCRLLTTQFPKKTAAGGVEKRFPEVQAGRSREAIVDRAAVGMQELVCGELVIVDDPFRIRQVLPEGITICAVYILWIGVVPVVPIQQEEIADDLDAGNDIASPFPRFPVQTGLGDLRGWRRRR